MKLGWNYEYITTVEESDEIEIGKYTEFYTDIWTFEILLPLEDLQKQLKEVWDWYFKFKKLDEYSKVIEHFWELVLDMSKTKVLWFREHTIIHDRVKQKEIEQEKARMEKEKPQIAPTAPNK